MGDNEGMNTEIEWKNLEDYVSRPVFDTVSGKWYILHGYKQYGTEKIVFLSDEKKGVQYEDVTLTTGPMDERGAFGGGC